MVTLSILILLKPFTTSTSICYSLAILIPQDFNLTLKHYSKTNYLKKTEESIEKTNHQNEKIKKIFQVLRDKSGENFNKNAEVINVFFENGGVVYLNLNRDFLTPTFSDEVKQYTIYSVVNTICDLGYSKVKFMIENEDVEKLGNSIGAMDAFSKDAFLIKGE